MLKEFSKKDIFIFLGIIVLFFAVRLPGIHIPYHQDEYKWPLYSDTAIYPPGSVPHPPLTEFIYRIVAPHFGLNNFRFIPLIFSFFNLLLIFYLARIIFDKKTAFWTAFLFAISFYSVLASLMVDVDGAVMPFFFLLSSISYFKLKESKYKLTKNWKWGLLLLLGAVGGFLVKVVFVLPIAAYALDFAIEKKAFSDKKKLLKYISGAIGVALVLVLLLLGIKFIFPFFNLANAVKYWEHFADSSSFFGRGWFQTAIQFIKAILYSSPLLLLPAFLVTKEIWSKTRVFFFFIFFGLFFYLIAFDFSIGAIDRYFEFWIVPLCIITGAVFSSYLFSSLVLQEKKKNIITYFTLFAVVFFGTQFLYQSVPSQYPKTDWIGRVISLKWNFLFPFTGGSGPTGFYVSFVFLGLVWFATALLLLKKRQLIIGVLILGLVYNVVFVEEYLFGKINGSPYGLFQDTKAEIIKNPDIKNVIVYNDIGGYEIQQTGKYFRRMYATPQFETEYRNVLGNFTGDILYIDIPKIQAGSFYEHYFNSCTSIFSEKDRQISATIYDCSHRK